jgi:hypothetical protein
MCARPRPALPASSRGIVACSKIVVVILAALAVNSVNSDALRAATAPRYPVFAIQSYLARCLALYAPPTTLAIADCDHAADQAFGLEEVDPQHRVRLHLAGQCVGVAAMVRDASVKLEPCSNAPTQIFALDGDSIILDANPDLVESRLSGWSALREPRSRVGPSHPRAPRNVRFIKVKSWLPTAGTGRARRCPR